MQSDSSRNTEAQLETRWALMWTSVEAQAVTSEVSVAGLSGKVVDRLLPGYWVPRVRGGGERNPA